MNKNQFFLLCLVIGGAFTIFAIMIWKHDPADYQVEFICPESVHQEVMQYNKMCLDDNNHSQTCRDNAKELFCDAKAIKIRD